MIPGIDAAAVERWLLDNVAGVRAPFSYARIGDGRSNLTYRVSDAAGRPIILRRPPLGETLATAHDMAREHRVIAALGATSVPVPDALGLCDDPSVTGAPFFVMSLIEGDVLNSPASADPYDTAQRRALSESLVDVLVELHAVDVEAVGLGDFGRHDGYIERQLRRWTRQWNDSKTRELPLVDDVAARLAARIPKQQRTSLVHGDYRFGNVIVDPDSLQVVAVLDWELSTLGDPLADIGYLAVQWNPDHPRQNDPAPAGGFLSFDEGVERYAAASDLDLADIGFYVGFQYWRSAVILEGVYARYLHGQMGDSDVDDEIISVRDSIEPLVGAADEALR